MDSISVSRLSVPKTSSQILVGGEAGCYDHTAVEAQGSSGFRVDPVDTIQKRGVQYYQGEDNVRFVEGAVEYIREIVGYEQGVFDAEAV